MIWGGKWEWGSGLGTHVHPWRINVDVWQNQCNIVKLKKKKKIRWDVEGGGRDVQVGGDMGKSMTDSF